MTEKQFKDHLIELNIELTEDKLKSLYKYQEMLKEYNKVMNLTGIVEKEEVFLKHFYDSLTIAKVVDLNSVDTFCDIGTGAGFPGLVVKIMFPNLKVTLVDSLNKRINFLNDVIKELGLNDIEAIHARAEEFSSSNTEKFDIVTARAVAPLNILLEISVNAIKIEGYFIAMKAHIKDELSESKSAINKLGMKYSNHVSFMLPIENSTRTLVKVKKLSKTSKKYPRKFSEIKKKPL